MMLPVGGLFTPVIGVGGGQAGKLTIEGVRGISSGDCCICVGDGTVTGDDGDGVDSDGDGADDRMGDFSSRAGEGAFCAFVTSVPNSRIVSV